MKYHVRSIPTLLMFKDGQVQATQIGAVGKAQLAQIIDKALCKPDAARRPRRRLARPVQRPASTGRAAAALGRLNAIAAPALAAPGRGASFATGTGLAAAPLLDATLLHYPARAPRALAA